MTPEDLSSYLEVLQKYGAMSYAHRETQADGNVLEFSITLGPINTFGEAPEKAEPGGWKGPQNLDSQKLFEYDREPNI